MGEKDPAVSEPLIFNIQKSTSLLHSLTATRVARQMLDVGAGLTDDWAGGLGCVFSSDCYRNRGLANK